MINNNEPKPKWLSKIQNHLPKGVEKKNLTVYIFIEVHKLKIYKKLGRQRQST